MTLSRWMLLIAGMIGLGCLQVAQHNALFLQGYAVGARMKRVHAQETSVSWLQTQVAGLRSPMHLARVEQERRLQLVAWSALSTDDARSRTVSKSMFPLQLIARGLEGHRPLVHLASGEADASDADSDTSD